MSQVSQEAVRRLRAETGVGIMDCKRALEKSNGDLEKAKRLLREEGKEVLAKASATSQGRVDAYIHHNGRVGVLLEVDCETDFVANSSDFRDLARNVAMHIAAAVPIPLYVRAEDIPPQVLEDECQIYRAQAEKEGKPPQIVEKMISGRLEKFYEQVCLLKQAYIRDPTGKTTIEDLIAELASKVSEKIVIRRFARFEIGR
jgi:elongation factor Ts